MKTLFRNLLDGLADAALLEEGIGRDAVITPVCAHWKESLEENLIEVAFAESADYDDIHSVILREHRAHCAAA